MLTEREQRFLKEYESLRRQAGAEAAEKAGYSPGSAARRAREILKKAEKEKQSGWERSLEEALRVLEEIMHDPEAKNSERLAAAKELMDRAELRMPSRDRGAERTGVLILDDIPDDPAE